jgi:hypothetical protein
VTLLNHFGPDAVTDQFGNRQSAATVSVYEADSLVLAAVFADEAGNIPLPNPVPADTHGQFHFWAAPGEYDLQADISGELGELLRTVIPINPDEPPGPGNPPTGPAGGVLGGVYPNPAFAADMATQVELDASLAAHTAAPNPHPVYATDADLAGHAAAGDPHAQYLTPVEHDALDHSPVAPSVVLDELGDVVSAGALAGESLTFDGVAWVPIQVIGGGGPPTGAAGGVLAGLYPNPGFAVDMATQAELDAHTSDAADAHDASAVSFIPVGAVAATDVQAAIAEVAIDYAAADTAHAAAGNPHPGYATDGDLAAHLADAADAHDASAVSFVPTGTIAATDVQAALVEVAADAAGGPTVNDVAALVPSGRIEYGQIAGPNPYVGGGFVLNLSARFSTVGFLSIEPNSAPAASLAHRVLLDTPAPGQATILLVDRTYAAVLSVDSASNPPVGVSIAAAAGETTDTEAAHTHGVGTLDAATEAAHTHAVDHDHPSVVSAAPSAQGTGALGVGTTAEDTHTHAVDVPAYAGASGAGSVHDHALSGDVAANGGHDHVLDSLYDHDHGFTTVTAFAGAVEPVGQNLAAATWRYLAVGEPI